MVQSPVLKGDLPPAVMGVHNVHNRGRWFFGGSRWPAGS